MFGVVYAAAGSEAAAMQAVAREFSPRIEPLGGDGREVVLDLAGVARLFGDARTIAEELRRTAADSGLRVRVAIAATRTAARLLVRHRAGLTIATGDPADAVATLPISLLAAVAGGPAGRAPARSSGSTRSNVANASNDSNDSNDLTPTIRRWGIRTLGEFAALPPAAVAARLGAAGAAWQRFARGEDPRPLVPAAPEERFEQTLELDWPIEGLEPLSFVFGRLLEPLAAQLERRDRGAAVLRVCLRLVDKTTHDRALQLPAPMRDPKALRTLALLDLESHPPPAAIDRVTVAVDPTPGRIVQFSLLTRALPSPERVSTLLARLSAVMGEGRCGSPQPVDSWQPGVFAMQPFAPREVAAGTPACAEAAPAAPVVALRRFRHPVAARVSVADGKPARVTIDGRGRGGGRVDTAAGPWRTSGQWWADAGAVGDDGRVGRRPGDGRSLRQRDGGPWDRDEWDVALADGATYRLYRERDTGAWFVAGIVD